MNTLLRIVRLSITALVLSTACMAAASACGTMDSFFDVFVFDDFENQVVTTTMTNIEVSAEAGETCFVATDIPLGLAITDVRFYGPDGGEFDAFREDLAVAAEFGPKYRAYSAVALERLDLTRFTLEIDVRSPNPDIGLPRFAVVWSDASIAAGRTDGAGAVLGHASIVNLRKVEMLLP